MGNNFLWHRQIRARYCISLQWTPTSPLGIFRALQLTVRRAHGVGGKKVAHLPRGAGVHSGCDFCPGRNRATIQLFCRRPRFHEPDTNLAGISFGQLCLAAAQSLAQVLPRSFSFAQLTTAAKPFAKPVAANNLTTIDRMEAAFSCNDTPFVDQVRFPLASLWRGRLKVVGIESDVTTANFVLGLPWRGDAAELRHVQFGTSGNAHSAFAPTYRHPFDI